MRVGIGKKEPVLSFVLGKFSTDDLASLAPVLEQAKAGLLALLKGQDITQVASAFNLKGQAQDKANK